MKDSISSIEMRQRRDELEAELCKLTIDQVNIRFDAVGGSPIMMKKKIKEIGEELFGIESFMKKNGISSKPTDECANALSSEATGSLSKPLEIFCRCFVAWLMKPVAVEGIPLEEMRQLNDFLLGGASDLPD